MGTVKCLVSPNSSHSLTYVLAWNSTHQPSVSQVLGLKGGAYITTHVPFKHLKNSWVTIQICCWLFIRAISAALKGLIRKLLNSGYFLMYLQGTNCKMFPTQGYILHQQVCLAFKSGLNSQKPVTNMVAVFQWWLIEKYIKGIYSLFPFWNKVILLNMYGSTVISAETLPW